MIFYYTKQGENHSNHNKVRCRNVFSYQQSKLSHAPEKADGAERDLLRHDRDEVI